MGCGVVEGGGFDDCKPAMASAKSFKFRFDRLSLPCLGAVELSFIEVSLGGLTLYDAWALFFVDFVDNDAWSALPTLECFLF